MKKILLISIIIALFAISGCITEDDMNKKPVDTNPVIIEGEDNNDKVDVEPENTVIDEVEEVIEPITDQLDPAERLDKELADGYTLTEEELAALKEKVKKGSSSAFLTTSYPTGLTYGEYHVFPLGLSNLNVKQQEYLLEVEFLRARDSKNNPIDVNKEEVIMWFKDNDFEVMVLTGADVAYLPVGVAINNEQPAGLYDFQVLVQEKDIDSNDWDVNLKLPFTVRVK